MVTVSIPSSDDISGNPLMFTDSKLELFIWMKKKGNTSVLFHSR